MDGWILVAMYFGPAAVLAILMNRSRFLRRKAGWSRFGAGRTRSPEQAAGAVLASLGTSRPATSSLDWRVFRPSIGTRLLPFGVGAALTFYFFNPDVLAKSEGIAHAGPIFPEEMYLVMMALVAWSCLHVLRAEVAISSDELSVRGILGQRTYRLDDLREIEEDGVHSFRLTFLGGDTAELFKTVTGAAELRASLGSRLDRNLANCMKAPI